MKYATSKKCPECKKVADYSVEVDEVEQIKAACLDAIDEMRWYLHLQKGMVVLSREKFEEIKSQFQKILEINSELIFKLKTVKNLTELTRKKDFINLNPQSFGEHIGWTTALSYLEGKKLPTPPLYPEKWIEDMTKEEYEEYRKKLLEIEKKQSKESEPLISTTTYKRIRCKKTGKYKNVKVS